MYTDGHQPRNHAAVHSPEDYGMPSDNLSNGNNGNQQKSICWWMNLQWTWSSAMFCTCSMKFGSMLPAHAQKSHQFGVHTPLIWLEYRVKLYAPDCCWCAHSSEISHPFWLGKKSHFNKFAAGLEKNFCRDFQVLIWRFKHRADEHQHRG